MANQLYGSFLQNLMEVYFGVEPHWTDDAITIYSCGVSDAYVFNTNHHEVEDLGANVVLSPVPLTGVDLTLGVFKAGDSESNVTTEAGNVVHAYVIFAGSDDGSQLMAYIDQGQPGQLPMTLLDGKLFQRWNPAGFFRI